LWARKGFASCGDGTRTARERACLRQLGGHLSALIGHCSEDSVLAELGRQALESTGHVHILVNLAGHGEPRYGCQRGQYIDWLEGNYGETMTASAAIQQTALGNEGIHLTGSQKRAVVAGSIGNMVEWLDWSIYSAFAPIFARQFFGSESAAVALLSALAVFAVGFVMRPIGGAVLGAYADRQGRKAGMTLTIGLMASAAIVIAICPTYTQIGVLAPAVLVIARLVQGFSAGGEFGSSSAFLVESAAPRRRAFAGSWQQVSVGAGVLLASLMGAVLTSTLSPEALTAWGWRVAFGVGGVLGLVGLWMRVTVEETAHFTAAAKAGQRQKNPLWAMLVKHPGAAWRVVAITIPGTLTYYIWVSYMAPYASTATGIPLNQAFLANTIAIVIFLCLLPFAGMLSDRIGRKPTMTGFALGYLIIAWPSFHFLQNDFWILFAIQLVGIILLLGYSANCAAVMAEQFPAEVRTVGIGLPYALAVAIFGGTAPYILTYMTSNGLQGYIWLYVAAAAIVGLIVYTTMPETRARTLEPTAEAQGVAWAEGVNPA
jgi:MFS transporter, MHS family, alpha-ketoglutarate permease